jgi:glycosyltransferase involved in cell wall biosynthesis
MNSLSIVVPCYNEAGNILLIINKFIEAIGPRTDIEVLLVNNGSTDNSAQIFTQALAVQSVKYFKVVNVPVNKGYGHGILIGLQNASSNTLAWTHADLQTDPKDVINGYDIYSTFAGKKVFIKGKRIKRNPIEQFFTFGMQIVALFALKTYLDDINAQPKIFSRDFYYQYIKDKAPLDFSLDLFVLFTAKKESLEIIDIPVAFGKRHAGEAKGGGSWKTKIKLIKRTLRYIFKLKKDLTD